MPLYFDFAAFYARGPYTQYSQRMSERMPKLLERWEVQPEVILDMACGEGTFAINMATQGYQVVGIDRSSRMLALAKEKAKAAEVEVDFRLRDMTRMIFESSFDLVTCWFDSLNYILAYSELKSAFQGAYRALRGGGLFVFDMNTVAGLASSWADPPVTVQVNDRDTLVLHECSYDHEINMAQAKITAFARQGQLWTRMQETHMEKGYYMWEIKSALREAGFRVRGEVGSIETLAPVKSDDPRVWYVCQKPFEKPEEQA